MCACLYEYNMCAFMFITMFQDPLGATGGATRPSGVHTSTRIGALAIDIEHGDLTKQETDAIVNSSDASFSLSGKVWNATSYACVSYA